MTFNTFLFDLDGTLTDPKEGLTNSVAFALSHYGINADPNDLVCFIGPPLVDSFMAQYGFERSKALEAIKYFREYFLSRGMFENEVYDLIPQLLSSLKSSGKNVALATSKPEPFALQILDHFDILQYFDVICGAPLDESIDYTKADVINDVISKYEGKSKDQLLMIGDRMHDVLGAHECGIQCVGVLYGYGSKSELENAGADFIADTIENLADFLLDS